MFYFCCFYAKFDNLSDRIFNAQFFSDAGYIRTSVYIRNAMQVIAVAWMDDKICVLCSSRMIYIFPDHEPFSEGIVEIDLNRYPVLDPIDMVACAANRNLCIIDGYASIISWIEMPTSSATVKSNTFRVGKLTHRPLRLCSVQPNQAVILQQSEKTKRFFLGVFTTDDSVNSARIHDRMLPREVSYPKHAIKLPNDDIVVAYTSTKVRPGRACLAQFSFDGNTCQMVWYNESHTCLTYTHSTTPLTYCNIEHLFLKENGQILASIIYSTAGTLGTCLCLVRPGLGFKQIAQYESDDRWSAVCKSFRFCYTPSKKHLLVCGQGNMSVYVSILNDFV